ncbi:hypothetical protein JG688_00017052, partial [Phytophthora aleatoria]
EDDSTRTMCGIKEFMPPEMIRRKTYSQVVDWWALCALIYAMVTGYPSFRHMNRKKLHHKILNEKLPLPKWEAMPSTSFSSSYCEQSSGIRQVDDVRGARMHVTMKHAFFTGID